MYVFELSLHIVSSMKDSEYSKGFAAYKRLLIHQYQLAYLNVTYLNMY